MDENKISEFIDYVNLSELILNEQFKKK